MEGQVDCKPSGVQPFTPPKNQHIQKVSDLLIETGQWNEALVRETFCDFDAEAILSMACFGKGDDFWAWEKEKHGNYSLRSAYRILESQRRLNRDFPEPSSNMVWEILWKMEVPPKVRVFWWRVLHEFLPA